MSLVNFVLVTSYTKNQAVKKMPIPNRTTVKWGNTAGFTGDTYRVIDSISAWKIIQNKSDVSKTGGAWGIYTRLTNWQNNLKH